MFTPLYPFSPHTAPYKGYSFNPHSAGHGIFFYTHTAGHNI